MFVHFPDTNFIHWEMHDPQQECTFLSMWACSWRTFRSSGHQGCGLLLLYNCFTKLSQTMGLLIISWHIPNLLLQVAPKKKITLVRSGEWGGQGQSPCLLISRSEKCPQRYRIVGLLIWHEALSCCHHIDILLILWAWKSLWITL